MATFFLTASTAVMKGPPKCLQHAVHVTLPTFTLRTDKKRPKYHHHLVQQPRLPRNHQQFHVHGGHLYRCNKITNQFPSYWLYVTNTGVVNYWLFCLLLCFSDFKSLCYNQECQLLHDTIVAWVILPKTCKIIID